MIAALSHSLIAVLGSSRQGIRPLGERLISGSVVRTFGSL
jgi:hypothetical protein